MYLHGAVEVITCDIAPLLKPPRVRLAMQKIVEYHDQQLLRNFWPDVQSARIEQIRELLADPNVHSTNELLNPLGIRVLVCDAQELPLETASVDLVSSYGVLMHIAPPVLVRVLLQFNRVLRFTGVTSHWIDLTDLYHWSDASLSPLNFLRYSDSAWRFWNDPLVPTNRLRLPAYRELFTQAGFQLAEVENRRGEERDLDRVPLDPQFAEIERDDLLVLDTWLAGRPNENLSEGKSREIREVSVTN